MPKVTFIIPCYNSRKTIEKTIASLLRQERFDLVAEIIVVDSSDDQETRRYLQSLKHEKLKLILRDHKTPPAQGRNLGAKAAQGDILCFIDSDVYLDPAWLTVIAEAYQKGCRAGCGSVAAPDFQQHNKLALAQLYLQFNESLNTGPLRQVDMVPACNMFMDAALFEQAGGFPELRASEDVLLCLKVKEWTPVWFVPEARCFHIFRESFSSYFSNQKVLGKYILVYRRMKYDRWYYRGFWPMVMLPAFLTIKFLRITSRIAKAEGGHFKKFLSSFHLFLAGLYYWAVGFLQGCFEKGNYAKS